jgi:hypothetical protein
MGAHSAQAHGAALVIVALTLISIGLAENVGVLWVLLGLVSFAIGIVIFLKIKPLEQRED